MSLTRITSDLIKDGTVSVADLASATKTAISGSSASGSVSTRTTTLETASGSFSTRITNATASINSISSSNSTRTTTLETASSSLASDVVTLKGGGTLQSVATNASPTFAGATITGTLTAQEVHTEFESASVIFSSGSTRFGDTSDDTHLVTGSMKISGSLTLNDGTLTVTDNVDFNGDLDVDGTTNLDAVDIDGAVDMASTLTIGGRLTLSNAGSDPGLFLGGGWQIFDNASESYGTAGDLVFFHGAARMVVGDTGLVGIGTTDPSGSLHISNTGTTVMYLEGDSNNSGQEDAYIKFVVDGQTQEAKVGWDNNNSSTLFNNNTENSFVVGCVSNLPVVFATNNTERMQIAADGSVKIGTVADTGDALITDGADGGLYSVLTVKENGNSRFNLDFEGNGSVNSLTLNSNSTNDILNIMPDGSIYMGVEHGTLAKNSAHRLSVVNPSGASWISTFAYNSYPTLQLYRTNNNSPGSAAANFDATSDGDIIGAINWYGSSDSAHTLGAVIDVRQDGPANTNTPTRMDFYVSNGANISNKLMSLDGSSQRVAIGVGLSPSGAPQGILEVKNTTADDYAASFHNIGNAANYYGIRVQAGANDGSGTTYHFSAMDGDGDLEGALRVVNGTFALYDNSDRRLKDNIRDTEINGTNIVNSIKVRDFEWKKSGLTETAGFIAQELKESFEPASTDNEDDEYEGKPKMMSISRERLVPVLVKAIQELSAKIDELQNQ